MSSIAILVLAAGKSSRMKDIKQLLKINNKTLLEITLETAKSITSETVFCVLGANAEKIKKETNIKNVDFIFNKNFENGLSSSIVTGIYHLKKLNANFDGVLILLADQPDVNADYLNELISIYKKNTGKIITSSYNEKAGVPAIFPEIYFNELLLLNGDKGAKVFLQNHKNQTIKLNRKHLFKDIDTQEDYQSYLKSI